jgi:hypothetical protein
VLRGVWTSLFCLGIVLVLQRAGDEFRGVGDVGLGLDARDELARNLSRKCCSQSAEGMALVWVAALWFGMVLPWSYGLVIDDDAGGESVLDTT